MRSILPALLLIAPALHAAENDARSKKTDLDALSLLPIGSELKGVMLPRYDKQQHLAAVLKARGMTLVSDQTIAGETVSIEFFNPDRSPRGRMDLASATFHQATGMLDAREPVTIQSEQLNAKGGGLLYALEESQGFLLGPVTTWTRSDTSKTAMKTKSTLRAAALAGAALVSQPVSAQTPPPPAGLSAALEASNAANAAAKAFLEKAELIDKNPVPAPDLPAAKPLDLKPGPGDTVINCDGGMYFNPDEGVFVYLKNVRVTDPRFTMTGADEVKVFLEKTSPEELKKKQDEKAAKAKAAGKEPAPDAKPDEAGIGEKFGDPLRVTATGAIVIERKAADGKEAVKASGGSFNYDIKADEAVITGRYPWLIQGGICLRAKQPDLVIRFRPKAGHAAADPGAWETIVNLERLKQENEKNKDANH